jgi:outer membrane protein OmpA-like peptidoglycan-associated protein
MQPEEESELSKERMVAVKRWLVKKRGLPARNITTEGFGRRKAGRTEHKS